MGDHLLMQKAAFVKPISYGGEIQPERKTECDVPYLRGIAKLCGQKYKRL